VKEWSGYVRERVRGGAGSDRGVCREVLRRDRGGGSTKYEGANWGGGERMVRSGRRWKMREGSERGSRRWSKVGEKRQD